MVKNLHTLCAKDVDLFTLNVQVDKTWIYSRRIGGGEYVLPSVVDGEVDNRQRPPTRVEAVAAVVVRTNIYGSEAFRLDYPVDVTGFNVGRGSSDDKIQRSVPVFESKLRLIICRENIGRNCTKGKKKHVANKTAAY